MIARNSVKIELVFPPTILFEYELFKSMHTIQGLSVVVFLKLTEF